MLNQRLSRPIINIVIHTLKERLIDTTISSSKIRLQGMLLVSNKVFTDLLYYKNGSQSRTHVISKSVTRGECDLVLSANENSWQVSLGYRF